MAPRSPADLYLDLLVKCLIGTLEDEELHIIDPRDGWKRRLWRQVARPVLDRTGFDVVRHVPIRQELRNEGRDWPEAGQTMAGLARISSLRECVTKVLEEGIPGDLLEAGTWRGGSAILMRAVLEAYGDAGRRVWVADSFQGVPAPDAERYPADAGDTHWTFDSLAVPLQEVKANFAKYGLLDDRVCFLEGWFKDTLPGAPIDQLAVLRIDGDLYESTLDALRPLYPKLSPGGFVIVDDYGCVPGCKQAVEEFRDAHDITALLHKIDWTGVLWRKE